MTRPTRDEDGLERLEVRLRGRNLHEPPRGVLQRAIALGDALPERRGSAVVRWLQVVFDSGREPLPAGIRGGVAAERRLLYQVGSGAGGEFQVDLRVTRERGGLIAITGQLLPPFPAGGEIEIRQGRTRRSVPVQAGGEFLFRGLRLRDSGPIELEVRGEDGTRVGIRELPLPPAGTGAMEP